MVLFNSMRLIKKLLILILLLIIVQPTYADEFGKLNLPTQTINPGDFYYPFVRLWEKIVEKFQFSPDGKYKYSSSLIDKRMSELGYVVKNKRLGEVQHSSERLSYKVGTLTDDLIKNVNKENSNLLKRKIASYFQALSELRDYFPANSAYWMLVQHDINSLKIYSDKLSK